MSLYCLYRSTAQSTPGSHNRVQSDGNYTYEYDAEGNTTKRTSIADGSVREMVWDYRGRLTKLTDRSSASGAVTLVVDYGYDALDRLSSKKITTGGSSKIEANVWDDAFLLMQLEGTGGNVLEGASVPLTYRVSKRFLHGPEVDMVLAEESYDGANGPIVSGSGLTPLAPPTQTKWLLGDHLGSVRDVVVISGDMKFRDHRVYDSFGKEISDTKYWQVGGSIVENPNDVDSVFGYTGREWDELTKLQYNRARWYDPAAGRWLSQDPIGFAAGDANLYRYVGNAATNATDPSGLLGDWQWAWHWHHLLPKEIFADLKIKGVDINSAEYGWMLRGADHIGENGIHIAGWNTDWDEWVAKMKVDGTKIDKKAIDDQLDKMIQKYDLDGKGFKAAFPYSFKKKAYKYAALLWSKGKPPNSVVVKEIAQAAEEVVEEAAEAARKAKPKTRAKVRGGIIGAVLGFIPSLVSGSDPVADAIDSALMTSELGRSAEPSQEERAFHQWEAYQEELDLLWDSRHRSDGGKCEPW